MRYFELFEAISQPTLEEFIADMKMKSQWLRIPFAIGGKIAKIDAYLRIGPRYIDGTKFENVFVLASLSAITRKKITFDRPLAGTGAFRELAHESERLAREYNYDAILVESVVNPKLGEILLRYGYVEESRNHGNYFKLLK